MKPEISNLELLASSGDVDGFVSAYVSIRKGGVDTGDKASSMLSQMGANAIERVAEILNDSSYSEDFRGTIANCLMRAIGLNIEVARSPSVETELKKALNSSDSFISMNAAEALVSIGVESIEGVPTREYAISKRNSRTSDYWNSLFNL